MFHFGLPATSTQTRPDFVDARGAREWLTELDSNQPLPAQAKLVGQLNLLNRFVVPAVERLRMVEELRPAVLAVQANTIVRFAGRPLPLANSERAALDANQSLWDTLATAYLHCLSAALDGDGKVVGQTALIAHRALSALACMQLDALRAAHVPAAGYWRRVHACFLAADSLAASERRIRDEVMHEERPTAVRAAYVLCVLLNVASPFGLNHRQLKILFRWLGKWSGKVETSLSPVAGSALPPLMVDLNADDPVARAPQAHSRMRWLILDEFAHTVRKRLLLLAQGEAPATLRLGEELSPSQANRLLRHLHGHCCRGGLTRTEARRPVRRSAAVVIGMDGVLRLLAGGTAPDAATAPDSSSPAAIETWQIVDDSATGLRLTRRASGDGTRIGLGMLVAVRPDDAAQFMLAHVCWTMAIDGDLNMGISLLAGTPTAVDIARTPDGEGVQFSRALLVPRVERVGQPECVALPSGWYRKSRDIVLGGDGLRRRVRLAESLERGSDFDLARIESLS
ncbi:hypothetical protein [Methyloversatilis thermotolerans]|uniref:hypothetical protein n=1 Tax=Methyloversatilis thermotolerans TaxID=1346290 RepID=UPI00035E7682|nr:hypothetical protein [Methyloversatilis thermotolerans]